LPIAIDVFDRAIYHFTGETNVDIKGQLWSIKDVSEYLNVAEKTVSRMIARGELPAFKIGGQWRFHPDSIGEWIRSRQSEPDTVRDLLRRDPDAVPLDRLIHAHANGIGRTIDDASEVLRHLAGLVVDRYPMIDAEWYAESLIARERTATTALSHGVAVPHIREVTANPDDSLDLFLLTTRGEIEFFGHRCRVFCLVCTDDLILHLRLIQKIGYALRDARLGDALAAAQSTDDLRAAFRAAERNIRNGIHENHS
jgi:PTS system nitrogen regulatory IIA component